MVAVKKDLTNPIGIFDSGLGGLSVLAQIKEIIPNENYIYYGDSINAPYGVKSPEEVVSHSDDIIQWLIEKNAKAIVIACNTATSAAAEFLRAKYDIPIIGMEPALKPAVTHSNTKKIAVMATDMTLREKKFNDLIIDMDAYLNEKKMPEIIKVPCPKLVELVEHGIITGKTIENEIYNYFSMQGFSDLSSSDINAVVLGCTHFSFLRASINKIFNGKVEIFDGNLGTAHHLKRILENSNMLSSSNIEGDIEIYNSMSNDMINQSWDLFSKFIQTNR